MLLSVLFCIPFELPWRFVLKEESPSSPSLTLPLAGEGGEVILYGTDSRMIPLRRELLIIPAQAQVHVGVHATRLFTFGQATFFFHHDHVLPRRRRDLTARFRVIS
jgi:hypothetical protein